MPYKYPFEDAQPPDPPNCRCTIRGILEHEMTWLEELEETLDERIGDTMPLIDEFKSGLIIEYMV